MKASLILLLILTAGCAVFYLGLRKRYVDIWFWSYVKHMAKAGPKVNGPVHLMVCFVDHYEPLVGKADDSTGSTRVQKWLDEYPKIADKYPDADGIPPQHTFFYPEDEYRADHLDMIAELCRNGYGDVEIHIHHGGEGEAGFKEKMSAFIEQLDQRHLLTHLDGKPSFAFIHGNWALDNSRRDGQWCGLDNEITILNALNCYADFTLPSAPSDTQTSTINSIYYAIDDPEAPKSHDTGIALEAGSQKDGDLIIVQGPLTLNWKRRVFGIWPRIENGDVTQTDIPIEERIDLWVKQHIHVLGRPEWSFIKVHSHGANDENSEFLFKDGAFETMCDYLNKKYNDGENYILHYVTARETYNIIKAAEAGHSGNPNVYRDFLLPPPPFISKNSA